jgi:hypothetical protein
MLLALLTGNKKRSEVFHRHLFLLKKMESLIFKYVAIYAKYDLTVKNSASIHDYAGKICYFMCLTRTCLSERLMLNNV